MLEHDSLRKILHQKAIDITTTLGLKCKIGDEPFVTPTDGSLYAEFWFKTGKTKQAVLGSPKGFECTVGVLQFAIYSPENTGDGPALKAGGAIKHAFNRKQWQVPPDGYVTLEPMSVEEIPGVRNGHKVTIVDTAFDFYHRNPQAQDFNT